ncbi:MAG: hypothetical protein UU77_C0006G0003 [candidate division WWE3 bacterium GW2011_GWC1_41_7]|jgi:membrane protein YdbS with pleckstrin-like domain|uniref:Uncharacterized protein n=3 Tax=Katanobacteria TaxID=422282 RepID=A0A0G0ZGR0_UNCKA|nr:MAG: hypothetical protein UU72_C0009G0027 [candidate division WWE3 bacterium GW2011_GWB1_41_6]KKS21216.1 MAG: hypothetical protein UU77_C0006G0003 [candidate division WWE3 bacterium GW2011_GWC1_41_7]KKS22057.1 MAG: hypothetical protein UU80_C0014G0012 [candidate division WWE3 bacterium GW2011_GWA1_41_8]
MTPEILSSTINHPHNVRFYGEDTDEEILYIFRASFVMNLGWMLIALFMLLAPIVFTIFLVFLSANISGLLSPSLIFLTNAFWYVFVLGFIFERFIHWFFNVYIITNKRIVDMDYYHMLNLRVSEATLQNIEDVTYQQQGAFESLFNLGHIYIQTAAERREFEFNNVSNPAKVHDILTDLVREVKGRA